MIAKIAFRIIRGVAGGAIGGLLIGATIPFFLAVANPTDGGGLIGGTVGGMIGGGVGGPFGLAIGGAIRGGVGGALGLAISPMIAWAILGVLMEMAGESNFRRSWK